MGLHVHPNNSLSRLSDDREVEEFNWCHNPEGPGGGRFCSPEGGGGSVVGAPTAGMTTKQARDLQRGSGPSGGVPKPGQPFGKKVPVSVEDINALTALAEDKTLNKEERDARILALLNERYPVLVAETQQMIERGRVAEKQFTQILRGFGERGYAYRHEEFPDEVYEGTTPYAIKGPLKELARSAFKNATDNSGDVSKLTDVVRGTLAVNSAEDVVAALRHLDQTAEIAHIKDNINHPLSTNYRDINVLIRLRNGMLAEVQIITKGMAAAKQRDGGHRLYERWRVLPRESPQATALHKRMEKLYGDAWGQPSAQVTSRLARDIDAIRKRVALRTRTVPTPARLTGLTPVRLRLGRP